MTRRAQTPIIALLAAAAFICGLLGSAPPASAGTATVHDPEGDAQLRHGLDVRSARLDNRQRDVLVTVRFTEVSAGTLVVSLAPRGGDGVRVVSTLRPDGTSRDEVLPGSFRSADDPAYDAACAGLSVRWSAARSSARLRMPARCLAHAEYGDLRFTVLTEQQGGGADADATRHSGWVPRG